MKVNKKHRFLFFTVISIFIIFFISVNAIENYHNNKKTILFVNGVENITEYQRDSLNVDSIANGYWDDKKYNYNTNHKYILIKLKTWKVIISTDNIDEIIEFTNK
ncbi:hypothetical protein [Paenibacillus prosopidis]|uniref:Uncharacterized protein n=1 Tax=Paenibacillus prosopidis TaxID=630520 RepID=A0A368W3S8_9BACL|nr:hypothetical protein [Paenibacillus prosopidis]RCW48616.1 hypothetical protein DFP97_106320 [Paenibacillus prosopidis]